MSYIPTGFVQSLYRPKEYRPNDFRPNGLMALYATISPRFQHCYTNRRGVIRLLKLAARKVQTGTEKPPFLLSVVIITTVLLISISAFPTTNIILPHNNEYVTL